MKLLKRSCSLSLNILKADMLVCILHPDICGHGEDARRHVGNDIEQPRKSTDRTQNKISYISGTRFVLLSFDFVHL